MPVLKDAYYQVNPLLPRRLLIALRRARARIKLRTHGDLWPIDEKAAPPPRNWQGWPDGKRFAFVMTHDVETDVGLDRCRDLMRIDQEFGIVSSFYFVPERYEVPKELRDHLASQGFEIAVQDLKHDGKLFRSRPKFLEHAKSINRYLKDWDVVGFRAGAMHHKLDWFHSLNIEYDASTFDYDPFEPQPDGTGTIFPFRVEPQNGTGKGYVEMPYTLPQDFTLFVILMQESIDLWKKKLDWVASKGGMCLLITHPDYMTFNGRPGRFGEYPADYYREFLQHVKEKYAGQYWNATPREVARHCEKVRVPHDRESDHGEKLPFKACMVAYTLYEMDNRVRRYAEALAKQGAEVDVYSLKTPGQSDTGELNGVRIHRMQTRVHNEKRPFTYLAKLLLFLLRSSAALTKSNLRKRYDLIHVHSVPDFEVFAALIPKWMGAKVILDIHDIVPEFYASKFNKGKDSLVFKTLALIEKLSIAFSDHVIIANHLWHRTLLSRSVTPEKCTVVMNYPDTSIFQKVQKIRNDGKFIMIYPGSLNWHQGLDIAIKAFAKIAWKYPKAEFHIYGDGGEKMVLLDLIRELNLSNRVLILGMKPMHEIAKVMVEADLGVVPKRALSFGDEAFSTKIPEFMAVGVPVIASSTTIDRYYFNDSQILFFRSEDVDDLASKMETLINDSRFRSRLVECGDAYVRDNNWDVKKDEYFDLIRSL
jgi:glycosyltransferase involved in cell wall biosynthesis